LIYIAQSVKREPLDQTNLKNDRDAILKAVENQHNNEADRWDPQGSSGLQVGPGGPTC